MRLLTRNLPNLYIYMVNKPQKNYMLNKIKHRDHADQYSAMKANDMARLTINHGIVEKITLLVLGVVLIFLMSAMVQGYASKKSRNLG